MNTEKSNIIWIRPHHLICMQGFQGYGYNKEFIKNMTKVINLLKSNSNIKIKMVLKGDSICRKCCNRLDGNVCINEISIRDMDKTILTKLNLKEGQLLKFDEFMIDYINNRIKNKVDSKDICRECSWRECCLWFKEAKLIDKVFK